MWRLLSPSLGESKLFGHERGAEHPPIDRINALIYAWAKDAMDDPRRYDELLRIVELPLLKAAIEQHGGNYAAAARALGMHRVTLRKKLEQFGRK